MTKNIDFYFDFASPYGYFSSEIIDEVAGRYSCAVTWRPYLMGAVMKITGRKSLIQIPMVNEYSAIDLMRTARFQGIRFAFPSDFPIATVAACRAYYWVNKTNVEQAKTLAHALFRAYFIDDATISKSETVIEIAAQVGIDGEELTSALQDPQVKLTVRAQTDNAIERKVFGSPFFIVDGEPFWGHDRISQLEKWLQTGGW